MDAKHKLGESLKESLEIFDNSEEDQAHQNNNLSYVIDASIDGSRPINITVEKGKVLSPVVDQDHYLLGVM